MKPQIEAVMTANTTGLRKGVSEVDSAVSGLGKKMRGAMGDALRGSLTAFSGAITGAVTAAFTKSVKSGMEQAFSMENAEVVFKSMLGSVDKARGAMAMLRQEAEKNPFFSKTDLANSAQALAVFANGSTEKLAKMVKQAELLATLKPSGGVIKAAEALRDAMTGEPERLKEYGFRAADLTKMRNQAGPGGDMTPFFAKALEQKGITEKTLRDIAQSRQSQVSALQNQLTNIGEDFVNSFWPKLEPEMKGLKEFLSGNKQEIIDGMKVVGDGIIIGFKAAMEAGSLIKSLAKEAGQMAGEYQYNAKGAFRSGGAAASDYVYAVTRGGKSFSEASDIASLRYQQERGAQLGQRGKELAPQVNIRVQAGNSSMLPQGMAHT